MPFFNPANSNPKARVQSFTVSVLLSGTAPATASQYERFWVAPAKCVVDYFTLTYSVASSSGTVQLEKVPSGTAQGSGTNILTGTVSTSSTANTNNAGTISTTAATAELAVGDALALVNGGTLTSLTDLHATVGLHWIS